MASNPWTIPHMGMEAMNSSGYFMAGNIVCGSGMMGADVTPFHPSMLREHGSVGFGLGAGAEVTVAEFGEQFATNNVVLASIARELSAAAPKRPQPEDEMDCDFDVAGGDSCSAASLPRPDQSGGVAVWSSSSEAQYGGWSSTPAPDRSRAALVHESYLAGIPDETGFYFPLPAFGGGVPSVHPATSELSLTLCSKSSSDSAMNAADHQCSSGASRSALTELPQARAPFAAAVARSRYAAVAQEVLNDIVGRLLDGVADVAGDSVDASSVVSSNDLMASSEDAGARWGAAPRGRSDLLKMLQMLDEKYNQCLDEVQSTTAKYNTLMLHGGAGAGICAPFAHRAVSPMYRGLRRRIAGAVMAAASRPPTCWGESSSAVERSWESALIQKHWALQKPRRGEQQCWRPQRGLPERSVAVLKAWMFEHFLRPYPDDQDKDMLAARSGLTRNQVSNWFINARVRIWKPMIEEMYKDLKRSADGEQGMETETRHTMSRAICCQLEDGP